MEIQLLLRTGRPDDVLKWMTPEVRASLGDFQYHWSRIQAFAAVGDYDAAHDELAALIGRGGRLPPIGQISTEVGGLIGKVLLDQQPGGSSLVQVTWGALSQGDMSNRIVDLSDELALRCNLLALRGLLAMEAGTIDRAREAFRASLTFSPYRMGGGQLEFNGQSVARDGLDLIDQR